MEGGVVKRSGFDKTACDVDVVRAVFHCKQLFSRLGIVRYCIRGLARAIFSNRVGFLSPSRRRLFLSLSSPDFCYACSLAYPQ